MQETQETVSAWCEEHYGGETRKNRLLDLFEEVAELAAALDLCGDQEILDRVQQSLDKSKEDRGKDAEVRGEIGDIQIATAWLATDLGLSTQELLDAKMQINRQRTPAQSAARVATKEQNYFDSKPE